MTAAKYLACIALALACSFAFSKDVQPDESQLVEQGHYKNKSGQDVHSPAHSKDGTVPQGASAKCRDGTYSFSKHHSGTCSRHGGVAQWLG
jgi:hypothetical protein